MAIYKNVSALLPSIQEKNEKKLEYMNEMLDRQFNFEVGENRKMINTNI